MAEELNDLIERAKRSQIGEPEEFIKPFDAKDYLRNEPMIEMLYKEKQMALLTSYRFEKESQDLRKRAHDLELEKLALSLQIRNNRRKSYVVFGLSLLALVFSGIGINIVTGDKPYSNMGWIFIVAAVVLELTSFFLVRSKED